MKLSRKDRDDPVTFRTTKSGADEPTIGEVSSVLVAEAPPQVQAPTVLDDLAAAEARAAQTPASGSVVGSTPPRTAGGSAGQQLGDVLVLRGLATHAQVQAALERQQDSGGRLGELLVEMGVLEERDLVEALAEFFGMPVADLRRYKPDPDALALVSEDVARQNMAMPISLHDDGLHVAVAEPSDALRFLLAEKSGRPVRLLLAPMTDVQWAIDNNYRAIGGVAQLVQAFEVVEGSRKRNVEPAQPVVVADDAPVVQVVDRILTQAMRDRASDVHIEPADEVVRVRFRIDGALKEICLLYTSFAASSKRT